MGCNCRKTCGCDLQPGWFLMADGSRLRYEKVHSMNGQFRYMRFSAGPTEYVYLTLPDGEQRVLSTPDWLMMIPDDGPSAENTMRTRLLEADAYYEKLRDRRGRSAKITAMLHDGTARAAREKAGLTLAEVAERIGISAGSIRRWESGKVVTPCRAAEYGDAVGIE